MTTITTIEETEEHIEDMPGSQLAAVRELKGFSREYVASKLHLRVRVIELLEEDDYENMPEPVFIKGYIRAYSKLLEVDSAPLLIAFNRLGKTEKKSDKAALWQSRRHASYRAEHAVKWLTIAIAAGVIIAVSLWWHKNKDNERLFTTNSESKAVENQSGTEVRLTDLSKMRSLLSSGSHYSKSESVSE